jgi:hypothetical protein
MKNITALVVLISSIGYGQTNTFPSSGNVGIGTTSPTAKLEVNQAGGASGQNVALKTWAGNGYNYFGNTQIQFSYGGGGGYNHAIKSRHQSAGIPGNAIDFFLWQPGDPINGEGSLNTMTLNGGNVGIGTVSPNAKVHINGSGGGTTDLLVNGRITTGDASNAGGMWVNSSQNMFVGASSASTLGFYNNGAWRMIVDNGGNVGIGTTSPQYKLEVHGTTIIGQYTNGMAVIDAFNSYAYFGCNNASNGIAVGPNGYVGIGTTSPDARLAVAGQVHAQEVKVSITVPGPDYVFDKDYKLTSLDEIKTYIDQNKHLPEIPSAKEMEKNGVQLGEMNMLLLKKIEELTLYVIELKKEVEELKENQQAKK